MCGIVGLAGGLEFKDEATMKTLLLIDYVRGEHSTGFAAIRSSNEEAKIAKTASNPLDLFQMQSFKNALNGYNSDVFIGHNRFATLGGVSTANAHPFQVDHIVGVHNGTLTYDTITDLEEAVGEKFSVDSQLLFAAVAKLGIEETIKLCTEGKESAKGAWALVWYDQKEKTLNFLRNKHRPLWYSYTKDFKRLFFASEDSMIKAAFILSKGAYEIYIDKEGYGYFPFKENQHYKFDVDAFKIGGKKPKPKVKELCGREAKAGTAAYPLWDEDDQWQKAWEEQFGTSMGYGIPSGGATNQNSNPKTECSPTTRQKTPSTTISLCSPVQLKHLVGTPDNPFAGFIDQDRWARFGNSKGDVDCAFCYKPLKFDDVGLTIMDELDKVLCRKCSGHPDEEQQPPVRIFVKGSVLDNLK